MAAQARLIRSLIEQTIEREEESGALHGQWEAFRLALLPGLTPEQFADVCAQTIACGLFAARVRLPAGRGFTRQQAAWNLPSLIKPPLRKLFDEIAGPDLDERIAWAVDDLASLLARADVAEALKDFGKATGQEDPVTHFYETFLAAYDPQERARRGVYYTPQAVVSYIVRSIDHLLKTRFDRSPGLADPDILILDPAVGTATFLCFVIRQIHRTVAQRADIGTWSSYVAENLLPRLFGFELLMAPYAVAHLKLSLLLQETGYDFADGQQLRIYLADALEETSVPAEVKKEKPIMVVLGNPPYSVSSAHKGERIEKLMERYKAAVHCEQNLQPLSDDYIKFIRLAQDRIERAGCGVVGMITNHSYLSGLIQRGMREELMKTFDGIYVLNLHGNALMGKTAPHGSPDENVFHIRQGVAIALFVKKGEGEGLARVQYAPLWGRRESKYRYLLENDVSTTEWRELEPEATPHFFFVPKEFDLREEFEKGWRVVEIFGTGNPQKDRGQCWGSGVKTNRDRLLVDFDRHVLEDRIQTLADLAMSDDEVKLRLGLQDSRYWNTGRERQKIGEVDWRRNIVSYFYRPFDERWALYQPNLIEIGRGGAGKFVMRHMLKENVALLAMRQVALDEEYSHFGVSGRVTDNRAFFSARGIVEVFPLYLYPDENGAEQGGRRPNLAPRFIAEVEARLGLEFISEGAGDLERTFGPEDVLHYAYAVFHAPTYRARYAGLLKIDFPRLPLTSDVALFQALAEKGAHLVALHLMESPLLNALVTRYLGTGNDEVNRVRYVQPTAETPGRVYVNQTQYFEGIPPAVWEFRVGGYQVLHKWLKDRKGRPLSFDDLALYQKIVVALQETMRLMGDIDEVIAEWPLPSQF